MRRGGVPRGLIGMLALVAAIEGSLARHAMDFTRFYIHDWEAGGRASRRDAKGCGVLCLGDSLVKFGVAPALLEGRLGTKAYNLAVCSGQAPSSYFLLRRALAAGARPTALVVDFVPYLLAAEPRHNLRQWPELFSLPEAIDLGWTTRNARFVAELALGMLLPSVKDRAEIRGAVAAALRGESASRRGEVKACRRHWRLNRGAVSAHERPGYRGEVDTADAGYFPRSWKCHPANEAYVRRLLDLASAHGIRVFWLLPPVAPQFQARCDEIGLEAGHERFVRDLRARYPGLTVVDGRRSGYGVAQFIDPLHLNRRGAACLSDDLAAILGDAPRDGATDRWITLPDYRDRPVGIALDDIDPSLPDERRR
jgi:hypothetical protein